MKPEILRRYFHYDVNMELASFSKLPQDIEK